MEDVVRQSSFRQGGGLKSIVSGRSTPRNSPSFRRLHSSRTPRRDGRSGVAGVQWFRSNRLIYWLLLITLWAYLGFYVQSKWAHDNTNKDDFPGFGSKSSILNSDSVQSPQQDLISVDVTPLVKIGTNKSEEGDGNKMDVTLAKKGNGVVSPHSPAPKKRSRRSRRGLRGKGHARRKAMVNVDGNEETEVQEPEIPMKNSTYGLLVGPFGSTEDRILEWSPEKRSGSCDRKGDFRRLVWSRKFVLIFHELSMTGAPLSMMELATELLSCGATVSAVVLSKKGGLMPELARRRIKVLEDRADHSFKTAMKSDLVIAGSAVCASWIEQYIDHYASASGQIAWWIMENRREYFDRSKLVLGRVKMLIFLSDSQSKQWLAWCQEENIHLRSPPALVPLAVNDELAFVAAIPCSLNSPSFTTEKMQAKKQLLRDSVRKEMGLADNDMLVMSLSSINPGKGQFLLLESARLMIEQKPLLDSSELKYSLGLDQDQSTFNDTQHSRALFQTTNNVSISNASSTRMNGKKRKILRLPRLFTSGTTHKRKPLSDDKGIEGQVLKVLIGSVGSKSNKVPYVKGLLRFLSQHSNLSKSVLWTPSTTRVASLYSAADVYVINSQGLGETFGRVTIEAMAFGLPVLGTEAGGTKEIVDHNVTGLLHPLGRAGTPVLAKNLKFFLENPSAREEMGRKGRKKVEKMYLKLHMYRRFAEVIARCMRVK